MRKFCFALIIGLGMLAASASVQAAPPGFYQGGTVVSPFGPTVSGFNSFQSPYGYRTFNNYSYSQTPWGWSGYQSQGTYVRPYSVGPVHSVYWDPFANTYRYGTGRLNTPSFYSYQRFGW